MSTLMNYSFTVPTAVTHFLHPFQSIILNYNVNSLVVARQTSERNRHQFKPVPAAVQFYSMPSFVKQSASVKLQTTYLRHSDINKYLDSLAQSYKSLVKVQTIGYSYENRPLKLIKISKKSSLPRQQQLQKQVVFIDAGCHAREWITISCALYCVQKLVEYSRLHDDLLSRFDFHILPVANPDGYEYSHTVNRFWRKTRRPIRLQQFGKFNFGTDLNRNYDFHWQDASANPSKYTFRGDKPFSEPETRALRSYLSEVNCKFYLTLHSHAQAICYPWGYSK